MSLCKYLDLQKSDDMKRNWLARSLPKYIKEAVFYAEGVDIIHYKERLKRGEFLAFSLEASLAEIKEAPKNKVPLKKGSNTKWVIKSRKAAKKERPL